jgi:hypothetical protein
LRNCGSQNLRVRNRRSATFFSPQFRNRFGSPQYCGIAEVRTKIADAHLCYSVLREMSFCFGSEPKLTCFCYVLVIFVKQFCFGVCYRLEMNGLNNYPQNKLKMKIKTRDLHFHRHQHEHLLLRKYLPTPSPTHCTITLIPTTYVCFFVHTQRKNDQFPFARRANGFRLKWQHRNNHRTDILRSLASPPSLPSWIH